MSTPSLSSVFGELVRSRRISAGLTQEALAERAEIHPTYVGLVERGKRNPFLDIAAHISDALGSTLAELIAAAEKLCPSSRKAGGKRA